MNQEQFIKEIGRLKAVYGEKAMADEKIKIIWERVKNYPQGALAKSIDTIIAEDHRPTMANISVYLGNNPQVQKAKELANWDCSHCGQSGFVEATNRYRKTKTAFKCSCVFGLQVQSKNIPEWQDLLSVHYSPDFYNFDERDDSKPKKIMHSIPSLERSKQLSEKYMPSIMAAIRFRPLPYDPNERLENIPF